MPVIGVNDQVSIDRPALGETWHGRVASASGRSAVVRWHSYTPPGGTTHRPMRHTSTVPTRNLRRAPRRRKTEAKARDGGRMSVTSPIGAGMIETKVGPEGYVYGWIKVGGADHDDLNRGVNPEARNAIKKHLDTTWSAHQAGKHGDAEDHLIAAKNQAIYGGAAPHLKNTIRGALSAVPQAKRNSRGGTKGMTGTSGAAPDGATEVKAGGPPLTAGAFVKWGDGNYGRIDMVVKSGTVPGVDGDVAGSDDDPAVRVAVWKKGDDGWAATGSKVGLKLSAVSRTAPLRNATPGGGESKDSALVRVLARHDERVTGLGLPAHASPGARAVLTVYDRGVAAWPGETKTLLSAEDWALGRVDAFLDLAAGDDIPGYRRDIDLLPAGHPARDGHP